MDFDSNFDLSAAEQMSGGDGDGTRVSSDRYAPGFKRDYAE
jgi:hypothetical protein